MKVLTSVRPNVRRLNWGAEVEEHLHGEAPDESFLVALRDDDNGGGEGDGYWNVAEDEA